jgi:hypothetical protein
MDHRKRPLVEKGTTASALWWQDVHLAPEGKRGMLTVDEKEVIRRDYFLHRKSMRQIARERHHSRNDYL